MDAASAVTSGTIRPAEFPPRADRDSRKTNIMIELTRLNGNRLAVNGDLIQFAEAAPDTLLTMVTGEKMLVAESLTEVSERMLAFRARTIAEAGRMQAEGFAVGAALRAVVSKNARAEALTRAYETDTEEDGDEAGAGPARRRRGAAQ